MRDSCLIHIERAFQEEKGFDLSCREAHSEKVQLARRTHSKNMLYRKAHS